MIYIAEGELFMRSFISLGDDSKREFYKDYVSFSYVTYYHCPDPPSVPRRPCQGPGGCHVHVIGRDECAQVGVYKYFMWVVCSLGVDILLGV